jgi:hypothetical protein
MSKEPTGEKIRKLKISKRQGKKIIQKIKSWREKKMKNEESLESQVKRLADFIMAEVPGEPSRNQGAIDTAIRIIRKFIENQPEVDEEFIERWGLSLCHWAHRPARTRKAGKTILLKIFQEIPVRIKGKEHSDEKK